MKRFLLTVTLAFLPYLAMAHSPNDHLVLILLGPPGVGKSTQARLINEERPLPHISTGDLLRYHVAEQTELGKQAGSYMSEGQLVPDLLVLDMLRTRLGAADCRNGFLLDGFPRTVAQAESLKSLVGSDKRLAVVNLVARDVVVSKRILSRQSTSAVGMARTDDQAEIVAKRLEVYHSQVNALVEHYDQLGVLSTVDAERDAESIFADIRPLLHQENPEA
jgi:adenylate kinase